MSNPNNNPYDSSGNAENFGDSQQPYGSGSSLPSYGSDSQQPTGGYQQGTGGYQEPDFSGYQQYQAGQYEDEPVKKSGLALAAFILGIISLLAMITGFSIIPGVIGAIVAIIALVVNRKKPKAARRTWMSVLGLIFSIIGIVATFVLVGLVMAVMGDPAVQACWDSSATQVEFRSALKA